MKVGIFTITLNRLYYTYHFLKSLKENAGYPYEHLIIDNGSTDGTYEWLKEEGYNVIRNEENKGITIASQQAIQYYKDKGIDILIKIDSDAELLTPSTIAKIVEFFQKSNHYVAISPLVIGIDRPPEILKRRNISGINVGEVYGVGGIFRAILMKDILHLSSKVSGLNDKCIFEYCRDNKIKMCYLTDYKVNHFETTKGQEKRYPEYFNKKYKY